MRFLVLVSAILLLLGIGTQQSQGTLSADAAQSGEWSGLVSWPAMAKHMILLPYDKALVFSTGADVQLWNIGSNTFKPVPATFADLHCAAHVTLADGKALVVGGQEGSPFIGTKIAAIFDPVTESWTNRTPMHYARWYPTVTTLPDGRVLATGGTDEGKSKVRIPEIYDPATDTWTELSGAGKTQPLYPFMYVDPTSGRLYDAAPKSTTEFLDVTGSGSWHPGPVSGWDNQSGGCCSEAGATYDIGKIMRTGGGDPAHKRTGVIDLTAASPQWRETAPMAFARRRHNLVILADGNLMAVGGTGSSDDTSKAVLAGEIWDRDTETWTTVASMATPRMYHSSAMLLPDGRVVAAGGDNPNATSKLTAQFYSPPYLFKGPKPLISTAPDSVGYGASFTLETPATGISSVALIRGGAPTHAIDMNQRYVPLSFSQQGSTVTAQAPASGNVAPPGYYMLVIEGADGTPSTGRWLRIGGSGGPPPPPPANRPPTANFTASTTAGAAPLVVDFSDTSADGPEQWEWDFSNDGTIDSTVRNPQFTYSAPGSYTVRLVARNSFGSDEEVKVGYVNVGAVTPPPPPGQIVTLSPAADARVQESSPTKNYGTSYLRVDGAGDPDVETYLRFDLSGIPGQVTSAKLRVFATSSSANGPAAYGVAGSSIAWPENTITWANRPARAGAGLDDKGSVKANTWLEYDVTSRVTGNVQHTFALATDSTDGVDISGKEVSDVTRRPQLVVTWANLEAPPAADFAVSPASGPAPLTVSFTDTSLGATSWAWDFTNDDSFESSAQNPTFTYADPGVYSVRLFVENDFGGDEVVKTSIITVTPPGPPPPATTTKILQPVADSYVKSDAASTNYGRSSRLRIDGTPAINAYLRFDVTGLAGPVVSAKLRLFVADAGTNAGALYPVSPLWVETGTGALTWANAPALIGTPLPGGGAAPLNTWVEFDVSGAVAGNGPVAFAVKGITPDTVNYTSREATPKPELVIATAAASPSVGVAHARH